jgi:spoIIIJ-associated protein
MSEKTMVSDEKVIVIKGEDVEQAIETGLAQLNVSREDVDVEVLDEGSSGFLGIGGREAQVRLTTKTVEAEVKEPLPQVDQPIDAEPIEEVQEATLEEEGPITQPESPPEEPSNEEEVAKEIVSTLLEKMQIDSTIDLRQSEPDDLTGERRWIVDITGEDMGVLIGPRGETLNSLQYVARLMTGHQILRRPSFIVDIEGYRARREQALARLAERMADKVVNRGHSMSLEPMPPNERRIIHITLREDDRVYTESIGEGRRRKVKIFLKH